ncbi:AzlC family ABC transporter permease [Actibacterium ureilyticum]|uniref:AzlC family ABC transporter permease n=1 Tax=Actibacterium ureilyticum TaxID=1590614 RepID=UPI000BAAFB4E|nr:AzlC family ABC transporter permease [Actibacterium ureilyticum]
MTGDSDRSLFWQGFRHGAPFLLVILPFGALFGVVGTEAGLNLAEVMGFSVLVIAGAAQFATLQLLTENAPAFIAVATGLAVNLRMVMYSASLTPHLGAAPLWKRALVSYMMVDQSYALAAAKYEAEPDRPLSQKLAYFFGTIAPIAPLWYLSTLIGAKIGSAIPPEFALDFALPITFLALIAPGLRTLAHMAAAGTSVLLGLLLAFMPYNLGLMIAALAAMAVGAQVELWQERQAR